MGKFCAGFSIGVWFALACLLWQANDGEIRFAGHTFMAVIESR